MNKRNLALLSITGLLTGVLALTGIATSAADVKAASEPKEYSVTFDPTGRPYPGTSAIYATTESGNQLTTKPTNLSAGGSTCICYFNNNGSFLDNVEPYQNITKIDVTYAMPGTSHGIDLVLKGEDSKTIETFSLEDDITVNEVTTRSFVPSDSSKKVCNFRFSSYEQNAVLYSFTVHYTCA